MNRNPWPYAVLFDMDGLLFDTERIFRDELKCVCATYGYEMTDEFYTHTLGTSGAHLRRIMSDAFGEDYPFEEITKKTWEHLYASMETEGIPLKPGMRELLDYLHQKKIRCVIASSSVKRTVTHHLAVTGLAEDFKGIVSGDMVPYAKPEPDIFLRACEEAGVCPKDALVLEDSENGVRAALKANIPVICIPDLKRPDETYLNQCEAVFANGFEVISYLESLDLL